MIDQDLAHETRGDADKVRAILPARVRGLCQAQEHLVDQRRRLERVAQPLAAHVGTRQSVQLPFDQRHQFVPRGFVTFIPRTQQLGDRVRGRWRTASRRPSSTRFVE